MNLRVQDAAFAYDGGQNVFEGLAFDTGENDFLCILGPNGCGKTTLLKCVAGMFKLCQGDVLLDGVSISSLKRAEVATRLGYIPQEHAVSFPYSVLQIVLMGRTPYLDIFSSPADEDYAIAEEAIERVGISHLKHKRYTQISGGEKQMALIARVLAQQPKMLLLDEPTSHLDFRNQALVLGIISRLAEEGLAVIMTSHFPDHAFAYPSRVALMSDGRLIAEGAPDEVVTEENLRATYGINVNVFTVQEPTSGRQFRFCAADEPVILGR
jgi:iron complex transport system ATP-binding protein